MRVEIFRKKHQSHEVSHFVEKPLETIFSHEWYLLWPSRLSNTFWGFLYDTWLAFLCSKFPCTFLTRDHVVFTQNSLSLSFPLPLKHSMFHSNIFASGCFRFPCLVILNSVKQGLCLFQVGWSRVGSSVLKASPFKEMMERTMTERERLAAERYFADTRPMLFFFSSWAKQLEHLPGIVDVSIMIIHTIENWKDWFSVAMLVCRRVRVCITV